MWRKRKMQNSIIYLLSLIIVAAISVYLTHYFTVRRFNRERKISLENEEAKRIEGMLTHLEEIQTAANIPREKYAKELLQKARNWFDENCLPYRNEEPYIEFEFLLKWVSSYTTDPEGLGSKSIDMFEKTTDLRNKITRILKDMKFRAK